MTNEDFRNALPPGAVVAGLRIDGVLGQGGFGITYRAQDLALDVPVALKEFFPRSIAFRENSGSVTPTTQDQTEGYKTGRQRFLEEARIIKRLDNPGVVKVERFFEHNNTAYFVMPYYAGQALDKLVAAGGAFRHDEVRQILDPLLDALEYIHSQKVYHRDIKPANIFLKQEDDKPILLDFGAARFSTGEGTQQHSQILGTPGYAPREQMTASGNIGPWTDIYGLAATIYRLLANEAPMPSIERAEHMAESGKDPLKSLLDRPDIVSEHGAHFLRAIEAGLHISRQHRPQSVGEWREAFRGRGREELVNPGRVRSDSARPAAAPGGLKSEERGPWVLYSFLALLGAGLAGATAYVALNWSTLSKSFAPGTATAPSTPTPGSPAAAGTPKLGEVEAYAKALEAYTPEAFKAYLADFPDGANADGARERLAKFDDEDWDKAQDENTLAAFESYLAEWPEGRNKLVAESIIADRKKMEAASAADRARLVAEEQAAWQKAITADSYESYSTFLASYPGGANSEKARERRDALREAVADNEAWQASASLRSKEGYKRYLDAFPRGLHVAEALSALEALTPQPGRKITDCQECPTVVIAPAGSFQQGAPDTDQFGTSTERPVKPVSFPNMFAIGTHEVTFAQWDACVAAGGCQHKPDDKGWGRGSRPVVNVSWNDAQQYVAWLSKKTAQRYSLPSESQWEFAARAGETNAWQGGSPGGLCNYANAANSETNVAWANRACSDSVAEGTLPAGSLKPNAFGLFDTLGNAAEWTQDCQSLGYRDTPTDGTANQRGVCGSRITRGGSWFAGEKDTRLSARLTLPVGARNEMTGFRVVRELAQ